MGEVLGFSTFDFTSELVESGLYQNEGVDLWKLILSMWKS